MNISMRDKKLLLMFSGVAVFGLGWFFGYRPQMEEAANIEAANKPLEERLSNLLELAGNRDFYISETENAQNKINEYVSKFPSDVKEENGIVLAQNIENSLGMQISNVGIATKEFVASIDGSTEEEIAEAYEKCRNRQIHRHVSRSMRLKVRTARRQRNCRMLLI